MADETLTKLTLSIDTEPNGLSSSPALKPSNSSQYALSALEERVRVLEQENQTLKEKIKSSEYFGVAAENTSNSVIIVNPEGITQWVNQSFERLSGVSRETIVGESAGKFLLGEHTNFATLQNVMIAMKNEESFTYEVQHYNSSGQPYQIIVNGEPIFDSDGCLQGYAMIETDVTLLKIMEKSLAEAHQLAEENEASKTNFLANLSHELCTPLNGILGITQLLETTPLNGEQTEFVKLIQESGENLLALIDELLTITEAPLRNHENEEIDLRLKLEKLVKQFRPECAEKGIALNLKISESIGNSLNLPWSKLSIALTHLCDNAVKFTAAGHVDLIVSDQVEHYLEFVVQDTGIGVPEDALPHIFDPFYQADSSHTRDFEGMGLGSTIVKRTLDSLNCQLNVETVEGSGSRFFFKIPY